MWIKNLLVQKIWSKENLVKTFLLSKKVFVKKSGSKIFWSKINFRLNNCLFKNCWSKKFNQKIFLVKKCFGPKSLGEIQVICSPDKCWLGKRHRDSCVLLKIVPFLKFDQNLVSKSWYIADIELVRVVGGSMQSNYCVKRNWFSEVTSLRHTINPLKRLWWWSLFLNSNNETFAH